jgi:hypothetical protein
MSERLKGLSGLRQSDAGGYFFRLAGQVNMIEETATATNGTMPNAHATLMPKIANNPSTVFINIAIQNLITFFLASTARIKSTTDKKMRPPKSAAAVIARSSMS